MIQNLTTVWRAVRPLVEYRLTADELEVLSVADELQPRYVMSDSYDLHRQPTLALMSWLLEIKVCGLISLKEYWHYENMIRFAR